MPTSNSKMNISHVIVLGDSLSDRGTFDKRQLFGFIPLGDLYEVGFDAPRGRFTNGFVWGDYFVAALIEEFGIDDARRKLDLPDDDFSNAEIGDAFLTNDFHLRTKYEKSFSLDNDKNILYKGERFARFYCEAGLTADNYKTKFTINPKNEILRLILANLQEKQQLLAADDKKYQVSAQEKAETLVIEWSGANDLLTVNSVPSLPVADNTVNARIANLEILIQQGYRNFMLLNMPDFSFTPRFQAKSTSEQENATQCSTYFNQQLQIKVKQLIEKYKNLSVPLSLSIFDVNTPIQEIYTHCESYGFDKSKLKSPFIDSEEFKQDQKNHDDQQAHISPAEGYMFWDDIHPTMQTHTWLATLFQNACDQLFKFMPPAVKRKCTKEAEDVVHPLLPVRAYKHLPEDVGTLLHTIHMHALSMEKSTQVSRRNKGEELKQFLYELKSLSGNLLEIDAFIKTFSQDHAKMNRITKHKHPVLDFFSCKRTTRTEEHLVALQEAIVTHLQADNIAQPLLGV